MAYRLVNPAPEYFNLTGTAGAAGGSLSFYQRETTTPKDTWSDPDMNTPNSNPVQLDSAGRANTEIWMDGEYSVTLRGGDGTLIWTRVVLPTTGAGSAIPPLEAMKFLTNDGSNMFWEDVRQVPDPEGYNDYVLGTDGSNTFWRTLPVPPVPPDPGIVLTATSFRAGEFFVQWGTGTAPPTGTDFTASVITFPEPFDEPPKHVSVTVMTNNINGTSLVALGVTGVSATGCNVDFNNADRHYAGSSKITGPVPYSYIAFGKKAVPAPE